MAYKISISRDVTEPSRHLMGLRIIGLSETDSIPTNCLSQDGAAWNNRIVYTGVFDTRAAAVAAVLDYINTPCALVQTDTPGGTTFAIRPIGYRATADEIGRDTVLGRRQPKPAAPGIAP